MMINWKMIKDFECYQVSTDGQVRSVSRLGADGRVLKGKLMKPCYARYERVILRKEGKSYGKLVHRLVAETFIPNPLNKPEVNHKNGNRKDNRVDNLEWSTRIENSHHAIETGLLQFNEFGKFIKTLEAK
jgi:hypothetical protein